MKKVQWGIQAMFFLLLLAAPWLVLAAWYSPLQVVWECHMLFETRRVSTEKDVLRSVGNYSQFFYANSSGFARMSGRHESVNPTGVTTVRNVHRFLKFDYALAGPYLKKTLTQMLRKHGDTMPLDSKTDFASTLHEETHQQVLKLGPKTYAFGRLGMPRQLCQGRQQWLTPRVR